MTSARARLLSLLVSSLVAVLIGVAGGPSMARAQPADDIETVVFGSSVQGRPLVAHHRSGAGETTFRILVVGVIHGDEPAGLDVAELLLAEPVPDGVDLWVVSDANPDGRFRRTRGNANGVDLNRNFPVDWQPYGSDEFTVGGYDPGPEPASEPETQALMELVLALQPSYSIWYHQPWEAVVCNSYAGARCPAYASAVGLPTMSAPRPGSATGWQSANGMQGAVVEFGEGGLSTAEAYRHVAAVLALAEIPTETQAPPVDPGSVGSGEATTTTTAAPPPEPEPAPTAPPPPELGDDAVLFVEPAVGDGLDLVGYVRNGGTDPLVATWAWRAPCLDQPVRWASQPVPPGAQLTVRCRLAAGDAATSGRLVQWSVSLSDGAGRSVAAGWVSQRLGLVERPETIGG